MGPTVVLLSTAPTMEQVNTSRQPRMNFGDLANLLDNDGNLQNEMMVASFAATMLATIPVLLGNEFDANVGLRKKRSLMELLMPTKKREIFQPVERKKSIKYQSV